MTSSPKPTVWTIGHSTRPLNEFIELLALNRIEILVDIRRHPGSRRYPHFNQDQLSRALNEVGVNYVPLLELGGRRRPDPNSKNTVWRNASFRAYADYMETDDFRSGIARLLELAGTQRTAVMCSEAVWWRCHRSLVADYLKACGVPVMHILDEKKVEAHPYTSAARLVDGRLSYEAEA